MNQHFFDVALARIDAVHFVYDRVELDCYVKRDDLIDPIVSGNKWRKLRLYVEQAAQKNAIGLLTFGGAYSNHLVATAKACHLLGLKSVGFVRGEELNERSNSTLATCTDFGMELAFVDRETYRQKDDYDYLTAIKHGFPNYQIVPEGGKGFYGMIGCQDILRETPNDYDHVVVACGTGTTFAGLLLSANSKTTVHGISALKGEFMQQQVEPLLRQVLGDEEMMEEFIQRADFHENFHFGGYGKTTPELFDFMESFKHQTDIELDKIYTAKAMYALVQLVKSKKISGKILFVHTGGVR
jgi:1-aminocyclopropane-1-carboxylate deaminase